MPWGEIIKRVFLQGKTGLLRWGRKDCSQQGHFGDQELHRFAWVHPVGPLPILCPTHSFQINPHTLTHKIWLAPELKLHCNSLTCRIEFGDYIHPVAEKIRDSFRAITEALWFCDQNLSWEIKALSLSFSFCNVSRKVRHRYPSHGLTVIISHHHAYPAVTVITTILATAHDYPPGASIASVVILLLPLPESEAEKWPSFPVAFNLPPVSPIGRD